MKQENLQIADANDTMTGIYGMKYSDGIDGPIRSAKLLRREEEYEPLIKNLVIHFKNLKYVLIYYIHINSKNHLLFFKLNHTYSKTK